MIAGIVASTVWRRAPPSGELELIFTERDLGVLFYQGEKHPGEGGDLSDTEWTFTPDQSLQLPEETPYAGIAGKHLYNVGPFVLRAGDGPIVMASGYYLHLVIQFGTYAIVVITTAEEIASPLVLDPAQQDAFNTWWDSKGPQKIQAFDAEGNLLDEAPMSLPTTATPPEGVDPTDPTAARNGSMTTHDWGSGPYAQVTLKLVPV